jgi:hypothetical protein
MSWALLNAVAQSSHWSKASHFLDQCPRIIIVLAGSTSEFAEYFFEVYVFLLLCWRNRGIVVHGF